MSGFTHDFRREGFTGFGSRMLRGARPTIRLRSLIVGKRQAKACPAALTLPAPGACRGSIKHGACGDCPAGSCLILGLLLLSPPEALIRGLRRLASRRLTGSKTARKHLLGGGPR